MGLRRCRVAWKALFAVAGIWMGGSASRDPSRKAIGIANVVTLVMKVLKASWTDVEISN